jgi:hypothetical protein
MDEHTQKPHGIGWYVIWGVLALVLCPLVLSICVSGTDLLKRPLPPRKPPPVIHGTVPPELSNDDRYAIRRTIKIHPSYTIGRIDSFQFASCRFFDAECSDQFVMVKTVDCDKETTIGGQSFGLYQVDGQWTVFWISGWFGCG